MDFQKAMSVVFKMFQRLTCVMTLPFGWPPRLIELMYKMKGIVSFDMPGLAAPECRAVATAAEQQRTRLMIGAVALPVVWILIFIEMIVIRNCTKMGKRKAARGTSLFGCTLFGFGKMGCPEGAFQSVVHALFFMNVVTQSLSVMVCVEVATQFPGVKRNAMMLNQAVFCVSSHAIPNTA